MDTMDTLRVKALVLSCFLGIHGGIHDGIHAPHGYLFLHFVPFFENPIMDTFNHAFLVHGYRFLVLDVGPL
jgi:hypothetical protein